MSKNNDNYASLDELFDGSESTSTSTGIPLGMRTVTVTSIKRKLSKSTQAPMYAFTVTHESWPQNKDGVTASLTGYALVNASGTLTSARQLFGYLGITKLPNVEDPEVNILDVMLKDGILSAYPQLKVEVVSNEMKSTIMNNDTGQEEVVVTPGIGIGRIFQAA